MPVLPVETQLENGLRILTVSLPGSLSVLPMILVRTGTLYESKEENGISHFLEHLMFKGTTTRTSKEIARMIDSLGGESNAFTWYDFTGYYIKTPLPVWKDAFSLLADIYLHPLFPQEEIDKERGVVCGEIDMYEDDPRSKASHVLHELLYGDQSAGWSVLGTKSRIQSMSRSSIVAYRDQHYVPEETVLVVAGDVSHDDVASLAREFFGHLPFSSRDVSVDTHIDSQGPRISFYEKSTDQAHIALGFHTLPYAHPDMPVLKVFTSLLGGGWSSRLFERLREDMGAGYYVSARQESLSSAGHAMISTGTEPSRVEEVIRAICEEIAHVKDSVSEEDLARTKEHMIGVRALSLESSEDWGDLYGLQSIFTPGSYTSYEDYVAEIRAVTIDDLSRVADLFIPSSASLVVVSPSEYSRESILDSLSLLD